MGLQIAVRVAGRGAVVGGVPGGTTNAGHTRNADGTIGMVPTGPRGQVSTANRANDATGAIIGAVCAGQRPRAAGARQGTVTCGVPTQTEQPLELHARSRYPYLPAAASASSKVVVLEGMFAASGA